MLPWKRVGTLFYLGTCVGLLTNVMPSMVDSDRWHGPAAMTLIRKKRWLIIRR